MLKNRLAMYVTRAGVISLASVVATTAFAVGPTVDQVTPTDAQRNATFASAGVAPTPILTSPAVAFGSPLGFGLNYGQVAVGIGGQTVPNNAPGPLDGSMGVAMGLGNSVSNVGIELTANIISLRSQFAEDGSFNAKVHRMVSPTTSVAVGAESFGGWGLARQARISSYAAVSTVVTANGMPVVLNAGLGNNRFRSTRTTDSGDVGAFASVAVVPTDRFSTILDFTGVDINAAISMVPVRAWPVTLTLGYVNLTEREQRGEFAGGLGYLYRF